VAIASPPKNAQPSQRPYSEADAANEVARHHLGVYGYLAHGHKPARVHNRWIDAASAVLNGTSSKRKLLIVAPPGHAKSTWLSLILPPWYLGNHPDHSILFFTSSDTMARQFGGTVKTTLESNDAHAAVFGAADQTRPDPGRGWSTDGLYLRGVPAGSKDPSYRALGYGAAVVGARAHGIILDDPLTQEQARSPVEQLKARQYHDLTVDSRLHPDGWELAIMTRWHDNDLAAHLGGKSEWDVLHLPALDDDDQALWPERFSTEWLHAKRAEISGSLFNCIYQGDPTALGGLVFKESAWFRPLPADLDRSQMTIVQFWDLAFSERQTADYSACCTLGAFPDGRLFILEMYRARLSPLDLEAAVQAKIGLWRPAAVGVEEGAFKQAVTADLVARLQARAAARVQAIKPAGDKVARAYLPAGRGEAGLLYADRAAPWFPIFESEALGFPLSSHDDQVDALSGAAQMAAEHLATRARTRDLARMAGQPQLIVRPQPPNADDVQRRHFMRMMGRDG
jgi:predicted phage terminase large subunit-like protein